MTRPIRLAATVGAALVVALLASQDAVGQNTQRCRPSNTTHTLRVQLPGVRVAHQTCVIRFGPGGPVKAWVHTVWRRTSFRTRFRQYTVQARLELRNLPELSLNCRYARDINAARAGQRTCETTTQGTLARGWTGDGAVVYRAGEGRRVVRLTGSPGV
jgi:hypothetical protein